MTFSSGRSVFMKLPPVAPMRQAHRSGRGLHISDLREVYEAVWGIRLNRQNFQRKVRSAKGFVVDTGKKLTHQPGRPAELFRRGRAQILYPPMLRPGRRGQTAADAGPTPSP